MKEIEQEIKRVEILYDKLEKTENGTIDDWYYSGMLKGLREALRLVEKFNYIRCLSPEIEEMHYQSRDRNQCYLQSLLTEAKGKGNLAMELTYALEKHLNK